MAAAIAVLSSCVKEAAAPAVEESAAGTFKIIGRIDNDATKTYYEESGSVANLYWNYYDQFKLVVYANTSGNAAFYTFHADDDAAGDEATFTINSGYIDTDNYTPAGYAVYPRTVELGGEKDAYTVTLSGEYAVPEGTDLSRVGVPMIGVAGDPATDANLYTFTPAVGVLKIQLKNAPAAARKLVLNAGTDAVAGKFPLDAANGFRMEYATEAVNVVTVSFPAQGEVDGVDLDIYVPVPEGTISAGATFQLQDADSNPLFTTPATTKAINVVKGHLTPIYPITVSEWKYLGQGKFIDNFMWYMEEIKEGGYVNVDIQQSVLDNTKYRVLNPYGKLPNTIQDADHDDYLEFTVSSEGEVNYTTHKTGLFPTYNVTIVDLDSDKDKVILGTGTNPEIVQFAPQYNNANSGSFVYTRTGRDNMIRIAFPGVYEQHCGTIAISGSADLALGVDYINANNPNKLTVSVSNVTLYNYYSADIDQALPNTCVSKWDENGNIAKGSLGVDNPSFNFKTSGEKYVFWTTYTSDGSTVLFQGSKKFYFLCADDVTNYIGQYYMKYGTDAHTTLTLALSDNLTKGNIQLVEFAGEAGSLYGTYESSITSAANLIFKNAYSIAFADDHYIYSPNYDLNLAIGANTSGSASYDSQNWDLISWNATITYEDYSESSFVYYNYMRGDKK